MKISRWIVLLSLLLFAGDVRADEPKKLGGKDRQLQERINEAVDRGVAWLRKVPLRDGLIRSEFGAAGPSALALYTLLVSGVPKDDERVKELAAALEKLTVEEGSARDLRSGPAALRMTYDHSLLVLALATLDAKAHRRTIARSVATLVRAQQSNGQWNYILRMGGPLDGGDNSNTQFALLALRLAKREGFAVPDAVWRRAYAHFAGSLAEDGGWGYGCEGTMKGTYGSMTAVGVASLVIARAMLLGDRAADHEYLKEPPIARGMIWLEDHFAADRNPGIADVEMGAPAGGPGGGPGGPGGRPGGPGGAGPGGPGPGGPPPGMGAPAVPPRAFQYYWLYAVERVGMLLSRKYVGNHDWYREGAEWLLAEQQRDGSFANRDAGMMAPEPPLAATCFALLFLKKGTLPVVTPPPEVKRDPRPR